MPKPTIVCLCGSTRFSDAFQEAQLRETLDSKIVLTIGCNMKSDIEIFSALSSKELLEIKFKLDYLHLRKIDLSDEILVLNVGGYIGESTSREVEYAISQGKKIRYLEDPECQSYFGAGRCDVDGELCKVEARGEDCGIKGGEMLTATFSNGRKIRAIVLDDSKVAGAIECCHCDCKAILNSPDAEALTVEIESFAFDHKCIKGQLLDEIVRQKLKDKQSG